MPSDLSSRAEVTTVNAMLERAAGCPDEGLRLLDRNEQPSWLSWRAIHGSALEVCGGLQSLGLGRGDRVALVFPTGWDFIAALLGFIISGAVTVPLYPPVRLGRLAEYHERTAQMLDACGARLVLADRWVRRILGQAVAEARPAFGCRLLDELPAVSAEPVVVDRDDLALVQFSSGSTMAPKAVALSHRAVVSQTAILNSLWPDEPSRGFRHSGVSWLPLYHDMGLIGCIMPALERPGPLTLIPPEVFVAHPAVWLRAISKYRATLSPAPNFAYGLCVEKIRDEDLEGVDLSCWQIALNGAEPVAPAVLRAFQERFARWGFSPEALTPVYGLSEAALAVTFSKLADGFTSACFDREQLNRHGSAVVSTAGMELVSVGRPLPGFELKIVSRTDHEVGAGMVGRVLVRGPSLMEGYLDRPSDTDAVIKDGWLDTGDLGLVHGDELYITGRAKDLLILRGRNHSPEEVERAVAGVAGLRTGCAVAVSWLPEGAAGEELLVFVEARGVKETGAFADECSRAIVVATGLLPGKVLVLEPGTLPRTSSGKLRRQEALRRFLANELDPPSPVNAVRLAGAMTRSALSYVKMSVEKL